VKGKETRKKNFLPEKRQPGTVRRFFQKEEKDRKRLLGRQESGKGEMVTKKGMF